MSTSSIALCPLSFSDLKLQDEKLGQSKQGEDEVKKAKK